MGRDDSAGQGMKLHLGCGNKCLAGWVNVDLKGADVNCDLRALPFEDDSADEIMAIHVVEHFMLPEILAVIKEWRRVLKPGGRLVIELPCWDKVMLLIAQGDQDDQMMRWALYGEPRTHKDGIEAVHKWCYSWDEFDSVLRYAGFIDIKRETPEFHVKHRDMRFEAIK